LNNRTLKIGFCVEGGIVGNHKVYIARNGGNISPAIVEFAVKLSP
jgi:hypothetical protein